MFARDTVPTFLKMFVSRGQTELQHRKKSLADHANQYRAVGRFAVKYGSPEVRRSAGARIDGARRLAEQTFTGLVVPRLGGNGTAPPSEDAPVPATPKATKVKLPEQPEKAERRAEPTPEPRHGSVTPAAATNGSAPDETALEEDALAIPEYDQLSASQVVERLDGLTATELDEVRAYELAHRGRSTILGKIVQLTA
jgi:hypothetical protein